MLSAAAVATIRSMSDHRESALDYLRQVLGDATPSSLVEIGRLKQSPLEGEGALTAFAFSAAVGGDETRQYVVVAGETEPNYYPAWNLSPDEYLRLHLGTRFMLVMQIAQVPHEDTFAALQDMRGQLGGAVPGQPIEPLSAAAAFALDDQRHLVARCRIGAEPVYLLGGDLPLGIYRQVDLPPHVIYRLHLGTILCMESDPVDEASG